MSNDYDFAIPELMKIETPRADGKVCQPIMRHNYHVVRGLLDMQTPISDLEGIICEDDDYPENAYVVQMGYLQIGFGYFLVSHVEADDYPDNSLGVDEGVLQIDESYLTIDPLLAMEG